VTCLQFGAWEDVGGIAHDCRTGITVAGLATVKGMEYAWGFSHLVILPLKFIRITTVPDNENSAI
jgi:hypothetical protein